MAGRFFGAVGKGASRVMMGAGRAAPGFAKDAAIGFAGEKFKHHTGISVSGGQPTLAGTFGETVHQYIVAQAAHESNKKSPQFTLHGQSVALRANTGIGARAAVNAVTHGFIDSQTTRSLVGAKLISPLQGQAVQASLGNMFKKSSSEEIEAWFKEKRAGWAAENPELAAAYEEAEPGIIKEDVDSSL